MANIIKEKKYIKSDFRNNNNKFWYIYLYDDGTVVTEYARVGKNPQSKTKRFGSMQSAENFFHNKCKEKETSGRNGEIPYRLLNVVSNKNLIDGSITINKDIASIAEQQIEHDSYTTSLIRYLAKVNIHNIVSNTSITYNEDDGLFSTPCGIVTASTISEARQLLSKIGDFVENKRTNSDTYGELLNNYFMLIPQDVGMKFDPSKIYKNQEDVRKQNDILDSLESSLNSIMNNSVSSSKVDEPVLFKTKLNKVCDDKILNSIKKKYDMTRMSMHTCHHLRVNSVYEIEVGEMNDRFQKKKKEINNVKELWHGSSASNLLSIMKSGLIIPPSNASYCTGRLFGNGIYASETSTKAAGYSYGFWGGKKQDRFFVFLIDMAMGKMYCPSNAYESFPVRGYDSTYVKPNTCGVKNNECIVYDTSQVNLKYLVELK